MNRSETFASVKAIRSRLRAEGNERDACDSDLHSLLDALDNGSVDDVMHEVCYLDLYDTAAAREIRNLVEVFWREEH